MTFSEVRKHPHWVARESFEKVSVPDGRTLELPKMPASLADVSFTYHPPEPVEIDTPDRRHKVIYCRATKNQKG